MLEEEVVRRVLAEAVGRGGDLGEIFAEQRSSTHLRLDDRRVEDVASGHEAGAGIRVISGDRSSYAYTNLLTTEALLEAARAARSGLSGPPGVVASDLRESRGPTHPVEVPPQTVGAAEKAAVLVEADDAARGEGADVRQVSASYSDVRQRVLIASSDGRIARDDRTRVRFAVQVVALRDGEIATGFEAPGHSGGFELLGPGDPGRLGASAARKALTMLDAR
jgi:TldD protein